MMETDIGVMQFEEGFRGHMLKSLEAEKGKETDSPLRASRGTQPCQYLDFRPVKLISDSEHQHWK